MATIEFFKQQAKNLLKDYNTRVFNEAEGFYEYTPRFFHDIDDLVITFDIKEDGSFTLMNAQHIVSRLAGFYKWNELIKASEERLELGKLLIENRISYQEKSGIITNMVDSLIVDAWRKIEENFDENWDDEARLEAFKVVFLKEERKIPSNPKIILDFSEDFIAQDMINYMRIAWGNRERKLFLKLCNRPNRYISRDAFEYPEVAFESLYNFYQDKPWMTERLEQWESDLKWIKKLAPYAAINYIRKGIGYDDFLKEYAEYRRIDEDELFDVLNELQENSRPFESFEEWMEHIRKYKEELEEQKQRQMENRAAVTMETMHSSKGLEYKVVFIIDANEEITPHHKAVIPADIEEERRMFYVAMTRAKDNLHIYYSRERYNKKLVRSRFVEEIMEKK